MYIVLNNEQLFLWCILQNLCKILCNITGVPPAAGAPDGFFTEPFGFPSRKFSIVAMLNCKYHECQKFTKCPIICNISS